MGMQIGIVGKPNVGKSTFFNAATDAHAEVANYPFTTIDANRGVMYVRRPCPCKDFKVKCTPRNSKCMDGTRFVPIEAIDVAGLVPDAHKGRGLGNKFLDDLRQADLLINVIVRFTRLPKFPITSLFNLSLKSSQVKSVSAFSPDQ